MNVLRVIDKIYVSDASWAFKFEAIFGIHTERLEPLLESLGIDHEWDDPDASHEEDVRAFYRSLDDLRKMIVSLFPSIR
jgi:hypothetical protein